MISRTDAKNCQRESGCNYIAVAALLSLHLCVKQNLIP